MQILFESLLSYFQSGDGALQLVMHAMYAIEAKIRNNHLLSASTITLCASKLLSSD